MTAVRFPIDVALVSRPARLSTHRTAPLKRPSSSDAPVWRPALQGPDSRLGKGSFPSPIFTPTYGPKSTDHWHYRTGRLLSRRTAACQRLRSPWHHPPRQHFQHRPSGPIYPDPHAGQTRLFLHYGDLSDASALGRLLGEIQPEEIYNLAAQSHVRVSFDSPEYTTRYHRHRHGPPARSHPRNGFEPRFYQASSSEMFGKVQRSSADGDDAVLSAQPLRLRQSFLLLDHRQLSRSLRAARQQRHPVQPRIAAPR